MQEVHEDCRLMCTANTWGLGPDREYVGRNALDVALLNEFVAIEWPYDTNAEKLWTLSLYKSVDEPKITEKQFYKFVERFQAMREYASSNKIRVIFATRNLRQCINLMTKAGWDEFDALDSTVFRSVKGEQRRRLLEVYSEKRKPIKPPKDDVPIADEAIPSDVKSITDDSAPF